jgi:non-ribosomal peptide synthetase component F
MKTYIVNENVEAVKSGETGKLLIGGPGVANGYLHQSGLTSECFTEARAQSHSKAT